MTQQCDVSAARESVVRASEDLIDLQLTGQIAHIVLNRASKMNAINRPMLAGVREALAWAEGDRRVRAVVLRGAGRAFSAGGDLAEVGGLVQDSPRFSEFLDYWHDSLRRLETSPLPIIAAVHGFAFAGGFELTQVCDVVVIGDRTSLADQHAKFGLFPAGGSTHRLPRLVPARVAAWMLMSGEAVTPHQALSIGLVNEVVNETAVADRAQAMAEVLASRSAAANAAIKAAVAAGKGLQIEDAIAAERPIALAHMASHDVQTGLEAFRSRTTPTFAT